MLRLFFISMLAGSSMASGAGSAVATTPIGAAAPFFVTVVPTTVTQTVPTGIGSATRQVSTVVNVPVIAAAGQCVPGAIPPTTTTRSQILCCTCNPVELRQYNTSNCTGSYTNGSQVPFSCNGIQQSATSQLGVGVQNLNPACSSNVGPQIAQAPNACVSRARLLAANTQAAVVSSFLPNNANSTKTTVVCNNGAVQTVLNLYNDDNCTSLMSSNAQNLNNCQQLFMVAIPVQSPVPPVNGLVGSRTSQVLVNGTSVTCPSVTTTSTPAVPTVTPTLGPIKYINGAPTRHSFGGLVMVFVLTALMDGWTL